MKRVRQLNELFCILINIIFVGRLAYSPIDKLSEKEEISIETLEFPNDESDILSVCLNSTEEILYVSKSSNIVYAIDLAASDLKKRPFIVKTSKKLESPVIQFSIFATKELWALLENGVLLAFDLTDEDEKVLHYFDDIKFDEKFGCISQIINGIMAFGSKDEPKLYFTDLNEEGDVILESIDVPFEELNAGSKGISSINLTPHGESILFSCVPEDPENDDVPLLLLENFNTDEELKFSTFFDPCASRPPRANQFYFLNLPFSTDNLCDFVAVGNFASPDVGICGRLGPKEAFQTFYIDNDEGLAQLPFIDGEMNYPIGLALDLSSKIPLENRTNPDAKDLPPAPILWIFTNSGHLCPFSMVKTDEAEPFNFMKTVPVIEAFDKKNEIGKEHEVSSEIPKTPTKLVAPSVLINSTPQTPSKVPLEQLASLQKSTEIKPFKAETASLANGVFSFKPAPVENKQPEPMKPVMLPAEPSKVSEPVKSTKPVQEAESIKVTFNSNPEPEIMKQNDPPEVPEPKLIKKEEKMESLNEGAYKNILLSEIAATHAAMQDDLHILKQLTMKNSLLLRQNSQKYFNSLESLEAYASSLEKLLSSSDKVFLGIKDKLDGLQFDLKELLGRTKQVKSTWNRIKQDNKIDWNARIQSLSTVTQDLIERIDRVRNFMSNPIEASKYGATLKSFVDSTQEKIQLLMANLSGLFISQNEDISASVYADLGALSLSPRLSGDNLLDQLKVLSLEGSLASVNTNDYHLKVEKRNNSLLNAAKSRGARLLIPSKIQPVSSIDTQKLKLTAEDEYLISSFISAIKLTDNVPEFAETAGIAKLSLNGAAKEMTKPAEPVSKPAFEPKPVETKKPDEPKSTAFEFKSVVNEAKPVFEFKTATETKPFSFSNKSASESKPASDTKPTFEFKPAAETKPTFEFKPSASEIKPFSFESKPSTETKPFSFDSKPTATETKPFSFDAIPVDDKTKVSASESKSVSFEVKPAPTTTESNDAKVISESSTTPAATATTATTVNLASETPKTIPSIFTVSSSPSETLPSLGALSFGGGDKNVIGNEFKAETPDVKPFPSIFGVKPLVSETETPSTSGFGGINFNQPVQSQSEKDPIKTVSASSPNTTTGFGFPSNAVKTEIKTTEPIQTAFSFAPTATASSTPSAFSITTKPNFPSASTAPTSSPVFGSTSMPKSSALQPTFGQSSFPSSSTSGFAAFAASTTQSQSGNGSFSSFANNNNNQTGLTFASFIPTQTEKEKEKEKDKSASNPSSTFSFTGFRDV